MKIHFYIRYSTSFGESLWLVGNAAALGADRHNAAAPMKYLSPEYWKLEADISPEEMQHGMLRYKYLLKNSQGEMLSEAAYDRVLDISAIPTTSVKIFDVWNYSGTYGNAFFTAPFKNVLLPTPPSEKPSRATAYSHLFKIKAPLLHADEVVCLCGEGALLKDWSTAAPLLLQKQGDWWVAPVELRNGTFPLAYKYGIYNTSDKEFVCFEHGGNRICSEAAQPREVVVLQDGFIHLPVNSWKGAGVAVPVFSLRSQSGFGVGEFCDLKLLADWAVRTGLKMIQVLPVNDTSATFTSADSYPYSAISAFALHPIFLNLDAVAAEKNAALLKPLKKKQAMLNALDHLDYEQVLKVKMERLQQIFDAGQEEVLTSEAYHLFIRQNSEWLKPYAAFCYLRDKYHTSNAACWAEFSVYNEERVAQMFEVGNPAASAVSFYCWLQYHLHLQLTDAVRYAHNLGVVIKGDIPIGVYRYGCDAWVAPHLYKMDMQAGAPPDDFAVNGQNWGFPTYNWHQMKEDDFGWWRRRFEQMSHYFDAFRIDHILGFFRIWSIPLASVQGIMGRFDACLPVRLWEFGEKGIWFDKERFCSPYITNAVLYDVFGEAAQRVKEIFLIKSGPDTYAPAPAFDTQQKIVEWFSAQANTPDNEVVKNGLLFLISNVILFEDESHDDAFHFRINMDKTLSFHYLPNGTKEKLKALYVDYFFKRQDGFWRSEGLEKLPGLKEATNMLVCGEDLGMVPDCVPQVMQQLGVLSLEIQRMPKQASKEFFDPAEAPYLSVVTPSTHDMSTIRGWWQEDRAVTQRFYNHCLGQQGEAPYYCEPWINRAIVMQHLYSPAMWSVFQIQDLLGMSPLLRRMLPEEERINIPADPHHYWCYRMHITLEQLLEEKSFNDELKGFVANSGRK